MIAMIGEEMKTGQQEGDSCCPVFSYLGISNTCPTRMMYGLEILFAEAILATVELYLFAIL